VSGEPSEYQQTPRHDRGGMSDSSAAVPDGRFAEDCLVCGATLEYATAPTVQACAYCGREESTLISCPGGHFVCDSCHGASAIDLAQRVLETSSERDPSAILERIMALPGLPMHGPEHHAIVAGVIVAAAGNAGVALPADAVATALRRAGKVPGGWCGYYGACGAAVGVGVAISVMTEATPLSGPQRSLALAATSFALSRMIDDQPRCCKRASRVAVDAAVEYLGERLGIELSSGPATQCSVSERNKQCPGAECPFFAA